MDFWNDMTSSLVDTVCGTVYSGFNAVLNLGNTVCIQMPKRALVLYFNLQKELLLLPFRILYKVYDALVQRPLMHLYRVYEAFTKEGPTAVELLTGEKNPSSARIMSSFMDVRKAALKTVRREARTRSHLDMYRKQLEHWRQENEKKTEEVYKLSLEEKDLMKAVASALRYLRSLKVKRERINDGFSDNLRLMMEDGTVTAEKLLSMQMKIKNVDAAIKEKKDACLDLLNQEIIADSALADSTFAKATNKKSLPPPRLQTAISSELVQKALAIVSDENLYLKDKVMSSQNTLERILEISGSIQDRIDVLSDKLTAMTHLNTDMDDLQKRLDEERILLKAAEADRDIMKEKLETLESMIKEEESFLSDVTLESAFDSDYSSLSGASEELSTFG